MTETSGPTAAERLMQKGAPFEVISARIGGRDMRVFRHAPPSLAQAIDQGRVTET